MQIGGTPESATLNGRTFSVSADSDVTVKLGGYENEILANGDGTSRQIKTRAPLMIDGMSIGIDNDLGDLEFLQDLANTPSFFPGTIVYPDGAIISGNLQISGEVKYGLKSASVSISLSGTGKLTKQA